MIAIGKRPFGKPGGLFSLFSRVHREIIVGKFHPFIEITLSVACQMNR